MRTERSLRVRSTSYRNVALLPRTVQLNMTGGIGRRQWGRGVMSILVLSEACRRAVGFAAPARRRGVRHRPRGDVVTSLRRCVSAGTCRYMVSDVFPMRACVSQNLRENVGRGDAPKFCFFLCVAETTGLSAGHERMPRLEVCFFLCVVFF